MAVTRFHLNPLLFVLASWSACVSSQSLSDIIPNEDVRNLTMEYMELCPFGFLCKVNISDVYTKVFFEPCCFSCSCMDQCYEHGDCCPDMLDDLDNVNTSLRKCLNLKYTENYEQNNSYDIIAACPTTYGDDEVVTQCNLDYQDYDINDGYTGFVPVTDTSSGETYKNIACLDCNNGSRSDALYWDIDIACKHTEEYLPWSPLSLQGYAVEDCNVVFMPRTVPLSNRPVMCTPLIEECNATGNIDHVDEQLETYCHAYTSRYLTYKNVHCALCNGVARDDILTDCLPDRLFGFQGYTTTMDVQGIVASEAFDREDKEPLVTVFQNCTLASTISDDTAIEKLPCVYRHCPKFAYLSGTQCKPLYTTIPNYRVVLRLRFYPKDEASLLHSFVQTLYSETEKVLGKLPLNEESNGFIHLLVYDIYVKVNETFDEHSEINSSSPTVIYVELQIQISAFSVRSVEQFTEDCLELYQAEFGQDPMFQKEFVSAKAGLLSHSFSFFGASSIELGDKQRERLGVTHAIIDTDGTLILHLFGDSPAVGLFHVNTVFLSPFVFCSQIVFDTSRFLRRMEDDGTILVAVDDKDVALTNVIFDDTYSHMVMCEREYEALFKRLELVVTTTDPNVTSHGDNNKNVVDACSLFRGETLFLSYLLTVAVVGTTILH